MDFAHAYSADNLRFLLDGLVYTLKLALLCIVLSFAGGLVLGVLRHARIPVLSRIVGAIVETIRNLPLLLIIFFSTFAMPSFGLKMSLFWSVAFALSVFEASMIAEVVRSGLASVEKGIIEAARSSGLTYVQTLRKIVLPIGLRRMVPPLVSQFISLLKDTSLAVIVSAPELMHNVGIVSGQNLNFVFPLLILAAFAYFAVNFTLSKLSRRLEAGRTGAQARRA